MLNFFVTVQLFYTFFADSPQRRWSTLKNRSKTPVKAALFDNMLTRDDKTDNPDVDEHEPLNTDAEIDAVPSSDVAQVRKRVMTL